MSAKLHFHSGDMSYEQLQQFMANTNIKAEPTTLLDKFIFGAEQLPPLSTPKEPNQQLFKRISDSCDLRDYQLDHLVEAHKGYMVKLEILKGMEKESPEYAKHHEIVTEAAELREYIVDGICGQQAHIRELKQVLHEDLDNENALPYLKKAAEELAVEREKYERMNK